MLNLSKEDCIAAIQLIEAGGKSIGYNAFLAAAVLIDKLRQEVQRLEDAAKPAHNTGE
jgi:hypothetical protein